jgi:hypothetical protein
MRKATIIFRLSDRTEHKFEVEGENQKEWRAKGERLLEEKIPNIHGDQITFPLSIDSFQTFPHDGEPGKDKQDAIRSSKQKVRMELVPVVPLIEVARVMTFGAFHYGDKNWQEGFSYSRCLGAAFRHIWKWVLGEDRDDESGLHHLAHVIANFMFLMYYQLTNKGTDDREKASPEFVEELFGRMEWGTEEEEKTQPKLKPICPTCKSNDDVSQNLDVTGCMWYCDRCDQGF